MESSESEGSPPARVAGGGEALGAVRFGTFRRYRSIAGGGRDVFPRGMPSRGARPIELVPLVEALERRWDDDRHFVAYTSDRPYRINTAALAKVRVEMQLVVFDVDHHHGPGTSAWLDEERPKIAALTSAHPDGFFHTTRRGWRGIYALPAPLPLGSEGDKEAFARWYARVAGYVFERFGVALDPALTRWNQPIRLPHVVREGRPFDAEVLAGEASAIGAFVLPADVAEAPELRALSSALPAWRGVAKRWQPQRATLRVTSSAAFDHVLLPPYAERVAAAEAWAREHAPRAIQYQRGRATARSVAAMLHVGFAVDRDDVARILVGIYNPRCAPPWVGSEVEDLREIAATVAKTPEHPVGFLLGPRDRTGLEAARLALAAAAASRQLVPLREVSTQIAQAIATHPALVVRATYGSGKTHGVARYVATRTTGRVVIVVPRHEIARTWVKLLADEGERDVAHHASVVQRRDERTGRRQCGNKLALRVYRAGGDVVRTVCPSCPRKPTCEAYAARPRAEARVQIVPRELLPKLEIRGDELVVFDDSAVDLIGWHRLSVRHLRRLGGADPRLLPPAQARLLGPFTEALAAGPRRAEEAARSALATAGFEASLGQGSALATLAGHLADGARAPRLPPDLLADGEGELRETLRDLERVRDVLRFAEACAAGGAVQWSPDARHVHGETPAAALLRSHRGRLVVLDAAANVEELRALRPDLHVTSIDVDDAGDVQRTLLFATGATRSALRKEHERDDRLGLWLGGALARLSSRRVRRLVLVVYKAIEAEVRVHPAVQAWLAAVPRRTVEVVHYGGLRGSNRFERCDAVVTVADPWLNGDDVVGRAERLALDEPSLRQALATAELGQAHGRSRAVRRRRRLFHVHVGRLVPDGWGAGVVLEPIGGPPERTRAPCERVEFAALVGRLGGNRGAAAVLGCSSSAIAGWRKGVRGLPRAMLLRARQHVATLPRAIEHPLKKSASSGEAARGARAGGMDAPAYKDLSKGCVHPEGETSERSDESVAAAMPSVRNAAGLESRLFSEPLEIDSSPLRSAPGHESLAPADLRARPQEKSPARECADAAGSAERRRRRHAEAVRRLAEEGTRVLVLLGGIPAQGPPRHAPVARTSDDELALLAEAQAKARRRVGLG